MIGVRIEPSNNLGVRWGDSAPAAMVWLGRSLMVGFVFVLGLVLVAHLL